MEDQRVLLIGINRGNDEIFQYEMKEMENLCLALGIEVIDTIIQNLDSPISSTYLGSGKLQEVKTYATSIEVDYIVINDELSPVQFKNITNLMPCPVLDRTMLILEIFKERAKTKEAVLQVELAELKYQLPRLAGSYTRLSRLGGGGGGGTGARRGSGETKIELDRRHIENQINHLKNELMEIVSARQINRKQRIENEIPVVALVGYTNAGKSSTMNTILNHFNVDQSKNVFVKNMLFATLETSTRKVKLPNNKEFLLTDTVGFVSKLPHHLVESFKSTLEEIKEASLIVHIIDASSPYLELQVETTNQVLNELGVQDIPTIYVFNKVDLLPNKSFIPKNFTPSIYVSNETKEGIDELIATIEKSIFKNYVTNIYLLPYERGDIYNTMKEKGEIFCTEYLNEGILVKATLSSYLTSLYKDYIK
ncbi:MAG: GTPase HflX [Bacilli bacterium]